MNFIRQILLYFLIFVSACPASQENLYDTDQKKATPTRSDADMLWFLIGNKFKPVADKTNDRLILKRLILNLKNNPKVVIDGKEEEGEIVAQYLDDKFTYQWVNKGKINTPLAIKIDDRDQLSFNRVVDRSAIENIFTLLNSHNFKEVDGGRRVLDLQDNKSVLIGGIYRKEGQIRAQFDGNKFIFEWVNNGKRNIFLDIIIANNDTLLKNDKLRPKGSQLCAKPLNKPPMLCFDRSAQHKPGVGSSLILNKYILHKPLEENQRYVSIENNEEDNFSILKDNNDNAVRQKNKKRQKAERIKEKILRSVLLEDGERAKCRFVKSLSKPYFREWLESQAGKGIFEKELDDLINSVARNEKTYAICSLEKDLFYKAYRRWEKIRDNPTDKNKEEELLTKLMKKPYFKYWVDHDVEGGETALREELQPINERRAQHLWGIILSEFRIDETEKLFKDLTDNPDFVPWVKSQGGIEHLRQIRMGYL
jgi:hypothetical protein